MKKLKLKYKDRYIENVEYETPLYEILKEIKEDYKYSVVGASLDGYLVDLNTKITENEKVEFYDTSSVIGNRIYARSLEFLITVACKKVLDNDSEVLINYSLENGVCIEITGKKISTITIKKIEEKMNELVNSELPINYIIVDRLDAIKYFKRNNQMDKVNSLKYMTSKTITLYTLDDVYDYFYWPLVYNTKLLNKFAISNLKDNKFILSYPTSANPNKVKEYIKHDLTAKTYEDFQNWGRLINIKTASDLNRLCALGQDVETVKLFETHYEDQLSKIAEEISKRKDKIKIILLAGPSSSGKTTTAKKLELYLKVKGMHTKKISLDNYFVDRIYAPKDDEGNLDYSDIKSLDVTLFQKQLSRMLKGNKVLMPTYDFVNGKKYYKDNYIKLAEDDIIIVEGIHTLNEKLTSIIPRENKYKIFISPLVSLKLDNHNRIHSTDVRKIRRIVRDNLFRGTSAEETLAMWPNVDKEAIKNIYPYQDDADSILNSSLGYELNVLRIYAEPLLYGIESTSKEYVEAVRLLNLLHNFLTITSEVVPKDSILREFIGGSSFKD